MATIMQIAANHLWFKGNLLNDSFTSIKTAFYKHALVYLYSTDIMSSNISIHIYTTDILSYTTVSKLILPMTQPCNVVVLK